MAKNDRLLNDYVVVYRPDHPKAMRGGNWDGYIYEHILMGEQVMDRPLKEGEVVHHLDLNRSNNSPDNILVLSGPMHAKLHTWLDKHTIIPKEYQENRIKLGCVRCKNCNIPILPSLSYCSHECSHETTRKYSHPSKEELEALVWSKPTTKVAKELGVSDVAVAKLCKKLNVDKPPRGYWSKVDAQLICPLKV
jgi:hypothetical protein